MKTPESDIIYDAEERQEILLANCRIAAVEISPYFRHTPETDERAIKLLLSCRNKISIQLGKADLLYIDQKGRFSDCGQRIRVRVSLETAVADLEKY